LIREGDGNEGGGNEGGGNEGAFVLANNDATNVTANLTNEGRITSGLVCSNGVHSLSYPALLAAYVGRRGRTEYR
jgi:hypothetical protein